ncbi:hypothetical protein AMECASPLE_034928, partial [Ameca splendens]
RQRLHLRPPGTLMGTQLMMPEGSWPPVAGGTSTSSIGRVTVLRNVPGCPTPSSWIPHSSAILTLQCYPLPPSHQVPVPVLIRFPLHGGSL